MAAKAAVAYVRSQGIPAGRIGLLCHSMGAAICLLTAPEATDVAAVVADSSYARLGDLLEVELPKASGLPPFFNPGILFLGNVFYGIDANKAAPESVVAKIQPRPILFIHSDTDELISTEHSRRLWRATGQGPETLWICAGAKHNRCSNQYPDEYRQTVVAFLNRAI
jgi:fermentation-respiration switch protein FrsA (DUF1100 family)